MATSEFPHRRTRPSVASAVPAAVLALSVAGVFGASVGTASADTHNNVAGVLERLATEKEKLGDETAAVDVQDGVLTVGDVAFTLPLGLEGTPADETGNAWSFEEDGCSFTVQGWQYQDAGSHELWGIAQEQSGHDFGDWLVENNPGSSYLDYIHYDTELLSFNLVFLLNAGGDEITGFMLVTNDLLQTMTEVVFTFPIDTFETSLTVVDALCQSAEPSGSAAKIVRANNAISALKESHAAAAGLTDEGAEETGLVDGTYETAGTGIGGDVPVTVVIEGGVIASVEVGDNSETQGIGSNAIDQLPGLIVEANGTEGVDGVSGATITSNAIFDAVEDCLEQARA